jgi:SOS-response transcriptional repressor LexA
MADNTESQKILIVQQKSGLSKKDFAATLGLSDVQFSRILSGDRSPSREVLDNLQTLYNVDLNWFLSGSSGLSATAETAYIELIKQEAAAGVGIEIEDFAEKVKIAVPASFIKPYSPNNVKAVIVHGDSMIGENIFDGDIVIFNPQFKNGNNIFVLSVGNTLLVKHVEFNELDGTIKLISANELYAPKVYTAAESANINIAGKVIAWIHKGQQPAFF